MVTLKALPSVVIVSTGSEAARPSGFHQHCIAARPVRYQFVESTLRPSSSDGVSRAGQAVRLEQAIRCARLTAHVRASVESIGFVSLDVQVFKKADGAAPSLL